MPEESPFAKRTRVICRLRDCAYHEPDPETKGEHAFCHHPDKAMYIRVEPCPLYRIDWKRHLKRSEVHRP
jgi:hypothetical protein